MPYNTRRKSVSLSSLGIHVPVTHASRAAARSPPTIATVSEAPPTKRMKRSHDSTSPPPMSPPPPPRRTSAAKTTIKYEHTPPPSPEAEADDVEDVDDAEAKVESKTDLDVAAINDEIVEAVVLQLQRTGNRPHLVKELAALLTTTVKIVEQSANPSAIISSRLSTYLKRPCWNANNQCPLAKELEQVHPRRTYFYLTTCAHPPIPDPTQALVTAEALRFSQRSIISPSLSSAASRSDEAEAERRRELSPSPEVDLSTPEFDDMDDVDNGSVAPPTPTGSFSGRLTAIEKIPASGLRNHRAASPPLEKDEKEFTQTARGMQKRKLSQAVDPSPVIQPSSAVPEVEVSKHMDIDNEFFNYRSTTPAASMAFTSSPAFKPTMAVPSLGTKKGLDQITMTDLWSKDGEWDLRSPEHVELHELDDMLDDF